MKNLGLILLGVGFFASAFFTVRQSDGAGLRWETVEWPYYSITFILGVVGVVLLRISVKSAGTKTEKLHADLKSLDDNLQWLNEKLGTLQGRREEIGVYGIHNAIDDELAGHLGEFADSRESMIHAYGLHEYASVMDRFARGERQINRAWSASADGYIDEVWLSLDRAQEHFRQAESTLSDYRNRT